MTCMALELAVKLHCRRCSSTNLESCGASGRLEMQNALVKDVLVGGIKIEVQLCLGMPCYGDELGEGYAV